MLVLGEADKILGKNKKVVRYRKPFNSNIGVIIFIFIFIYMVYNIFSYMTAAHISVYEVEQGTMARNNIYRGLILRDEQVYLSAYTGTLNYYIREASRVGAGNLICSVDVVLRHSALLHFIDRNVRRSHI